MQLPKTKGVLVLRKKNLKHLFPLLAYIVMVMVQLAKVLKKKSFYCSFSSKSFIWAIYPSSTKWNNKYAKCSAVITQQDIISEA